MYLKQIADEVGDLMNDTTLKSGGTLYARTKSWINQTLFLDITSRLQQAWYLKKQGSITSVDEYTTGTVTVTEGSTSVTGSGTAFTSSMEDRMLVVNGYAKRISSVTNSTTLVLESAWERSSASTSFSIVQDLYKLPAWLSIKNLLEIKLQGQTEPLRGLSDHEFNGMVSSHAATNDPKYFVPYDRDISTYTTGTVSGTANAKTLTGSSTAWSSSNIAQYDKIKVGSYVYTVDSVDSDTQITLLEDIETTISSGTSYVASMERDRIRLYPFPKYARTFIVTGTKNEVRLEDDSDTPFLPEEWHYLLVKGAYIKALKHDQDPGVEIEIAEFNADLNRLVGMNNRDNYRTDSWWR